MCAPSPRATMYGSPPTDLNARIEEFTPPGMTLAERSKKVWFDAIALPVHTVALQPADTQRDGSQNGIVIATPIVGFRRTNARNTSK